MNYGDKNSEDAGSIPLYLKGGVNDMEQREIVSDGGFIIDFFITTV